MVGRLRLDLAARRASVGGRELVLRPKEFDLLVALASRAGELVSREDLMCRCGTRTGSGRPRPWRGDPDPASAITREGVAIADDIGDSAESTSR